ncbi:DUF1987 domain-containing protein [Marinigracilibium pacificum]|uniref:DUF1987 domain-containing protein n=1 Tax=Marinigracilibium pacificum TaxID=2729599 RepID=A0A848IYF4_9BACT|nr:DUF1987 domain-containing protein [Marinigracilibium pacificum]NMM49307.1 DUF1987 domain-containing protein [Marinigracilibium pacificum]
MNNLQLNITPSQRTPSVDYKVEDDRISISGRLIPENAIEFFHPLFEWADQFFNNQDKKRLEININLDYFNTSSSKCLIEFFRKMEICQNNGKSINVNWIYDKQDESMFETAEDFMNVIDLPFELKPI